MKTETVYLYDDKNEYCGTYKAHESPLEPEVFIVPERSIPFAPPLIGDYEIAVAENGKWIVYPDYRGLMIYSTTTAIGKIVVEKGEIPEGYTLLIPCDHPEWNGTAWIENTIAKFNAAKSTKLAELADYRWAMETRGITVGDSIIKTDEVSQAKLTGAWCKSIINPSVVINWKGRGKWMQIGAAQIQQLASIVSDYVESCYDQEKVHDDAIQSLTTVEEIIAYDFTIGWPE